MFGDYGNQEKLITVQKKQIHLNAGDVIFFKPHLVHCGSAYHQLNVRIFGYFDHPDVVRDFKTTFRDIPFDASRVLESFNPTELLKDDNFYIDDEVAPGSAASRSEVMSTSIISQSSLSLSPRRSTDAECKDEIALSHGILSVPTEVAEVGRDTKDRKRPFEVREDEITQALYPSRYVDGDNDDNSPTTDQTSKKRDLSKWCFLVNFQLDRARLEEVCSYIDVSCTCRGRTSSWQYSRSDHMRGT